MPALLHEPIPTHEQLSSAPDQFRQLVGEYFGGEQLDQRQIDEILDFAYQQVDELAHREHELDFSDSLQLAQKYGARLQQIADGVPRTDLQLSVAQQEANQLFAFGVFAYAEQNLDPTDASQAKMYKNIQDGFFLVLQMSVPTREVSQSRSSSSVLRSAVR